MDSNHQSIAPQAIALSIELRLCIVNPQGFEPWTNSLRGNRSTTELEVLLWSVTQFATFWARTSVSRTRTIPFLCFASFASHDKCFWLDLNQRPSACRATILPTELQKQSDSDGIFRFNSSKLGTILGNSAPSTGKYLRKLRVPLLTDPDVRLLLRKESTEFGVRNRSIKSICVLGYSSIPRLVDNGGIGPPPVLCKSTVLAVFTSRPIVDSSGHDPECKQMILKIESQAFLLFENFLSAILSFAIRETSNTFVFATCLGLQISECNKKIHISVNLMRKQNLSALVDSSRARRELLLFRLRVKLCLYLCQFFSEVSTFTTRLAISNIPYLSKT